MLAEIDTLGDCVNVHVQIVSAKMRLKPVVNATRNVLAVVASIRDKDFGHRIRPHGF
jgi:hypothetical protein